MWYYPEKAMFKIELVVPNVFFGRMVMLRKEKKKIKKKKSVKLAPQKNIVLLYLPEGFNYSPML